MVPVSEGRKRADRHGASFLGTDARGWADRREVCLFPPLGGTGLPSQLGTKETSLTSLKTSLLGSKELPSFIPCWEVKNFPIGKRFPLLILCGFLFRNKYKTVLYIV